MYDLLVLAKKYKIVHIEGITLDQWKNIQNFINDPMNDRKRIEYYYELSEENVDFWEVDQDEFEDLETYESVKKFRKANHELSTSIRAAYDSKDIIADLIADKLLDRASFEDYLLGLGDLTIEILSNLANNDNVLESVDEIYPLNISWESNFSADVLEQLGYAIVKSTKPWKNEDDHRHIVGITISSDVLELFKEIYSEKFNYKRRNSSIVQDCCYIARNYYKAAPIDIVLKLYHQMCQADSIYPELDEESFIKTAEKVANDLYIIYEHEGKKYVIEEYLLDSFEDDDEDYMILFDYLDIIREQNYDFYIPDADEFHDYLKNGYWSKREPYQKLKEWLTNFYLDEKDIANMFPSMLRMLDPEDYDENEEYYNERYSMDDLEEDVSEKMRMVIWYFMENGDVDYALDELEDLTAQVREEVKEELAEILHECLKQTNKVELLGYCEK